jgi:hypothetical protein
MKILNTIVSVFLAISVLIISAFLLLALVLQFKWWSFLAIPLGIVAGVIIIILGSMANDYIKYAAQTGKRRGYFDYVRKKPDWIKEAEKIPNKCSYSVIGVCESDKCYTNSNCPRICPRYKGDEQNG